MVPSAPTKGNKPLAKDVPAHRVIKLTIRAATGKKGNRKFYFPKDVRIIDLSAPTPQRLKFLRRSSIPKWQKLDFYGLNKTPLLFSEVPERLMAKKLEVLADGICDAVVLVFFERMRGDNASAEWTARQVHKIEAGVCELARLVEQSQFAVGNKFGLADIAVGSALGYLRVRFKEFKWQNLYPALANYSTRLEQRPSFQQTQPYPQTISDKVV